MNKKYDNSIARNGSDYIDPTAADAIANADEGYIRFQKLLKLVFALCELSGFHLEGRLTVKDMKTGKMWR